MAGLDDLIQAMALNQKQQSAIAADDPYDDFSALGQQTIQASLSTPGLSSRERIIGAILGGIGGGISQGLSSDYRGRALTAYNDVLSATKNGNEIEQPSVLSPSIFAQAQQDGTIWKQLQADALATEAAKLNAAIGVENRKGDQETANKLLEATLSGDPKKIAAAEKMVAALKGLKIESEPIVKTKFDEALATYGDEDTARRAILETDPAIQKAKLDFERQKSAINPSGPVIPPVADALSFTAKQFDDAKQLNSIKAAIPGTTASNEFAGIQTNLRTKLQQMIGREMNGPEQEKLMSALPDWNDTSAQIDKKKERFLDLVSSVAKPSKPGAVATTPDQFTGRLGLQGQTPVTEPTKIPEGAVPTGRTSGGKPVYDVGGKMWVAD